MTNSIALTRQSTAASKLVWLGSVRPNRGIPKSKNGKLASVLSDERNCSNNIVVVAMCPVILCVAKYLSQRDLEIFHFAQNENAANKLISQLSEQKPNLFGTFATNELKINEVKSS